MNQIKTYIASQSSPAVARRVLRNIHAACRLIASDPGIGHVREDLTDKPVKFWRVYSYLLVYDPASTPLRVIRLLHGARDVEHLLESTAGPL
ncbi:MAG: type II toxin-antitoxin system RelE/ParE family toxin [Acidobacteria bacterium]|nr:type II toxin-antitoxin system RelE/ParE family toxin [Acidobacteriota bacterium]